VDENNDDKPPAPGLDSNLEQIFGGMAQAELESLTIDAIHEYRASVAAAEAARLVRVAAEADTDCCPHRLAELKQIHEHAETEHRARQLMLNNLVDRLGYVPKIPLG
jgi:hypothetical protein